MSIMCKVLKIVLMHDKHLISLNNMRRKRRSCFIWSSQLPCEVGWARLTTDTSFLRGSRPRENTLLIVVAKYRSKFRHLKFQV